MNNLPIFGRKSAAVSKWLAALFLLLACFTQSLFSEKNPFVLSGELFFFDEDFSVTKFSQNSNARFMQKGVCASRKDGNYLVWDQKNELLLNLDESLKIKSKVEVKGNSVYLNQDFILAQSNSFDEKTGFPFTLYKIKYSKFRSKISVKVIWKGNIDCFISDLVFLDDGICIAGGNQDNEKHNVYVITEKGIHKCFSMPKNGDFLRLLRSTTEKDTIFAFVSGRDKIKTQLSIYSFETSGLSDAENCRKMLLDDDILLPSESECFFGYGFTFYNNLVLPLSVDGTISFVSVDPIMGEIVSVTENAVGCTSPLALRKEGFCYIARDPLIPDSWYGLAVFDGKESNLICSFK